MPAKRGSLAEYEAKRNFKATPEPAGSTKRGRAQRLRFVIQKHRATRLHYDFRLEAGGVLASWAVPKGPSLNPADKRLAMHVEDHPFDYRSFEGVIPGGNYGAGEVIVWDEGTYTLAEGTDPVEEIAHGKIKFILSGKKLKGEFTLVKIHSRQSESGDPWLLIKDHDGNESTSWKIDDVPESVKTGHTIEDIAGDKRAKTWISDRPAAKRSRHAAVRTKEPAALPVIESPMLATLVDEPFDDPNWLFEIKWDGFRAIATIAADGTVQLASRNGKDLLLRFPVLRDIGAAFKSLPVIVDGEIVSLDGRGHASFQRLQDSSGDIAYVVFDLLFADGRDLRGEPLETRKARLQELLVDGHGAMYSKHLAGRGKELYAIAERERVEGIMAKRRDSRYVGRRSRDWLKIKTAREQEFVIGGWTDPRGSRAAFGSLLLGVYDGDDFVYVGNVGTGFDAKLLREIGAKLDAIARKTSPFVSVPREMAKAHFTAPKLVAQVKFSEWTRDGILRQPVFLGLRDDKDPKTVVRERELDADKVH